MSAWLRSSRSSVAWRSGRPAAKLTIASRVQVMWSSHSLRMPSWSATCLADSRWWAPCATGAARASTAAAPAARMRMGGLLMPVGVTRPRGSYAKMTAMGFDQSHEPAHELPAETRTFARLCASLTEEAEAIGWYEQRMAVESDREASAIMRDAQGEEFKHFCMDLEFLLRRTPLWREIARGILFQEGDIVEHGEEAEEEAVEGAAARGAPLTGSTSLGIGSLKRVVS